MIDSLTGDFDPAELTSEYRRDLRAMLEAKLQGTEIERPEPVAEEAEVVDLMEALRRSVAEAKERNAATTRAPRRRKPPRRRLSIAARGAGNGSARKRG